MNNDNFLIETTDIELAKSICNLIDDNDTRKRSVANVLAANLAGKYFTEVEVDTESGIYNVAKILENIDISDVYIRDSYIDVRLYFEPSELCVPKSHFDLGILPVAYMFIKLDSELSGGLVTGFIQPSAIDTSIETQGYYKVNEDDLTSFYDIEPLLIPNYSEETPDLFESTVFDFLDGRLANVKDFYKSLISSRYCREILLKSANVQDIFNFISIVPQEKIAEKTLDVESETFNDNDVMEFTPLDDSEMTLDIEGNTDILEDFEPETLISDDTTFELEESASTFEIQENAEPELLISEDTDTEITETTSTLEIQEPNEDLDIIEETSFSDSILPEIENDNSEFPIEESTTEELQYADTPATDIEATETYNNEQPDDLSESYEIIQDSTDSESEITEIIEEYQAEPENINEFSTSVTPSIESLEEASDNDLEQMLNSDKSIFDEENNEIQNEANNPQIEELFGDETESQEVLESTFVKPANKGGSKILPLLGTLVILGGLGYFGYTKFFSNQPIAEDNSEPLQTVIQPEETKTAPAQDAMPIETVENIQSQETGNEGNAISIPAIEKNLDASILVSNLSVNWEVPASYLANNTAKRYFTKMGKIIQLNLKTELLLLSKPPITNKIEVELEFNKANNKFKVKGITASSGEKTVDDLIVNTVNRILDMNLKTNMSVFANTTGNPVLIIRL